MHLIAAYLAAAVVFLAVDALMLSQIMRPLFEHHLGDQLRDSIRMTPAALFYLAYVAGLTVLVIAPALRGDWPAGQILLTGAIIGAMAYGTYEVTSFAVMANWHWSMVAADTAWGTALTAASGLVGVWAGRAFA